MPMSSKFLTESAGVIVKIGQYLAKIWTKYDSLVFGGPPCRRFCGRYVPVTFAYRKHISAYFNFLCVGYTEDNWPRSQVFEEQVRGKYYFYTIRYAN